MGFEQLTQQICVHVMLVRPPLGLDSLDWTGLVDWNDKLGLEGARGAQNVCSVGLPESSAIYIAGL